VGSEMCIRDSTASRLANKDDGKVAKLRAAGDKRREDQLKGRDIAKRDRTSKDSWQIDELSKSTLGSYLDKKKSEYMKGKTQSGSKENAKDIQNMGKAQDKKMKSLTEILEATAPKLHPDALHVTPVKVGGQTKYHVKAVGKNISHGIKVGEHLTDTHLDDATEMGAKIKHIKENIEVEVFEPEADMNILIQLRKSVDILEHGTQGGANVVFGNGETMFVEGAVAKKLVESLESIKPNDRATVASFLYQSHDNMMAVYGRLK
jgi:hypothetical protein